MYNSFILYGSWGKKQHHAQTAAITPQPVFEISLRSILTFRLKAVKNIRKL